MKQIHTIIVAHPLGWVGIIMITIHICVGSSCYLKGSQDIVALYERLIKEHSLKDKVQLKGAFCLKNCSSGITIMIGKEVVVDVTKENCEQIFKDKILGRIPFKRGSASVPAKRDK